MSNIEGTALLFEYKWLLQIQSMILLELKKLSEKPAAFKYIAHGSYKMIATIYQETLKKGNYDEFDKSDSNFQTKITQNQAIAISASIIIQFIVWAFHKIT